jgi:ABC-type transport system involved in cytochrome bd biosynthesis fused ATPase/permease subunit
LVIVGETGVGKTTLLYSIMGENIISKGTSDTKGTIAYVEQEPFIIQGSVKENILFGKQFNQEVFDNALKYS